MLNIYNYYDDSKSLPLYNELEDKLNLLNNPSDWRWLQHNVKDFEPIKHIMLRSPKLIYYYAHDIIKGRWPDAEPYIMKSPEYTYRYVRDILSNDKDWTSIKGYENGRWPEAEQYIMSGSLWWNEYKNLVGIE